MKSLTFHGLKKPSLATLPNDYAVEPVRESQLIVERDLMKRISNDVGGWGKSRYCRMKISQLPLCIFQH